MKSLNLVTEGFQIARRHKKLILALWLVPLVPALVLGVMAGSNIAPCLSESIFADRALEGDWFVVLMEFRSSRADALDPIVGIGVILMLAVTLFFQVALSAGVVQVLLERDQRYPFALGVRKNFLRFLRTTILLSIGTVVVVLVSRFVIMRGFFKLAEAQADGRLDILGIGLAVVFVFLLWAPLDLAADLSRIAAAHHDHRSMVRGFFRAFKEVVRRPGLFIPIYLVFLLLPVVLHGVYYLLRSPWTPATAVAILILMLTQQAVILIRAFFKLGFWGTEIAAFRHLDGPEFCRPKLKVLRVEEPVADTLELQGVDEVLETP